jgi:hypothetical protein
MKSEWTIKFLIFSFVIVTVIIFITYLFAACYNLYANFYVALDNRVLDVLYFN